MIKKWGLVFLILGSIILLFQKREWVTEMIKGLYDEIYKKWADLRSMDWKLLKAIAQTESSENPNALGDDGRSFGLMQISALVGQSYGMNQDDLYNPDLNIQVGSGFLKEMIDKYGLQGGIQAYNLGETKYKKGFTSPTYLAKVLQNYENLGGIIA